MSRILLLEDDLSLVNGLSFAFKKWGFSLDVARTLLEAERLWEDGTYDLLVLDVALPDGSGFAFCKKVRQISKVPIIFLTASDEEMNIIMGLDIGGDDYITNPSSWVFWSQESMRFFGGQTISGRRTRSLCQIISVSACLKDRLSKTGSFWI